MGCEAGAFEGWEQCTRPVLWVGLGSSSTSLFKHISNFEHSMSLCRAHPMHELKTRMVRLKYFFMLYYIVSHIIIISYIWILFVAQVATNGWKTFCLFPWVSRAALILSYIYATTWPDRSKQASSGDLECLPFLDLYCIVSIHNKASPIYLQWEKTVWKKNNIGYEFTLIALCLLCHHGASSPICWQLGLATEDPGCTQGATIVILSIVCNGMKE